MCGGGVRSILSFTLVARDNRCVYMAHVSFSVYCNYHVGYVGTFVV